MVVARRACIFVDRSQWSASLSVDSEACNSCKLCIRIGCPAISMDEVSAHVDSNLCLGCGLCAEICPQEAFITPGVEEKA